jgi:quinol monooxygenase YgiN
MVRSSTLNLQRSSAAGSALAGACRAPVPCGSSRLASDLILTAGARATLMIHVIATIELNPGRRDAFLAEFHKIVPLVLAEAGCLEYGPTIDVATGIAVQLPVRDDVATIVEKWESVEHLQQHLAAPHVQEYRPKLKDMVARTTLLVLTPA